MSAASEKLETPLTMLVNLLPDLIHETQYSELYGYDLTNLADTTRGTIIRNRLLEKFLVANKQELEGATDQLRKTLIWRRDFNPLSAGFLETHTEKMEKQAVITSTPIPDLELEDKVQEQEETKNIESDAPEAQEETLPTELSTSKELPAIPRETESPGNQIMTWNLYNDLKNKSEDLPDFDAFIRWRVGVMERGIALLDFTKPETSYMAQLHYYHNFSILRMDTIAKEATKASVTLFQTYYPEILNVQYLVNIPTVMQWVFSLFKHFVAKQTFEKFRVVSNSEDLAKAAGNWVPKQYGGEEESLEAFTVKDIKPANPELVVLYVPKSLDEDLPPPPIEKETEVKVAPASAPAPKEVELPQDEGDDDVVKPPVAQVDINVTLEDDAVAVSETPKPAPAAAAVFETPKPELAAAAVFETPKPAPAAAAVF